VAFYGAPLGSGHALSRGRPRDGPAGGVSAHLGDGRFCNPIGAVKRHLFTFFFVLFLCSAEEAVSSSQPTRALELCAQAASRLVASGGHPKGLALMLPSTVRSYVWCGVL
jgi:hypothetical protein